MAQKKSIRSTQRGRPAKLTRIVSPAKKAMQKAGKRAATKRAAAAAKKAERTSQIKGAVDAAVAAAAEQGFNILTPDGKIDIKEARKAAEAAAENEAAKYGINIRKDNGKISRRKARQAAEAAAVKAAAEMGFNIHTASGKINRKEARKAARAAQDAREGKPVSQEVARAVSRRDAVLVAKFKAAERQGLSIEQIGGDVSRRDAYTNNEIVALIRRALAEVV
ncbi:MAG: hypothetical protein WBF90_20030 [Rivularia sp. (in: cyanobacteria)]